MKTITKITLTIAVLISCFAVIHLLQQEQSSPTMYTPSSGTYSVYSTTPNIPVYKGSGMRTTSSGQGYSGMPAVSQQSSNVMPLTSKGFGNSDAGVSIYGGNVIQSSVDFKSSSPVQTVNQADYGFYAYSGLFAKGGSGTLAGYGNSSKPDGLITPLSGTGGGSLDPDNEDPETIPGTLPVGNGVWVLLLLAAGYLGTRIFVQRLHRLSQI